MFLAGGAATVCPMPSMLREKLLDVAKAVLPLVASVCVLQVTLIRAPAALFLQFLGGALLAIAGMVLIFVGIDFGILPMGRFIGARLPQQRSLFAILGVAFALGFATTVAEPDVLVLAKEVGAASSLAASTVRNLIALGVGVFVAIAVLRVVYGWPMLFLLAAAYGLVIVLSFFTPADFVPLAYDAGSVTTGVLSAPAVLALALGLSSVLSGRSALEDGFGILGSPRSVRSSRSR